MEYATEGHSFPPRPSCKAWLLRHQIQIKTSKMTKEHVMVEFQGPFQYLNRITTHVCSNFKDRLDYYYYKGFRNSISRPNILIGWSGISTYVACMWHIRGDIFLHTSNVFKFVVLALSTPWWRPEDCCFLSYWNSIASRWPLGRLTWVSCYGSGT
jgi:hypothetical protein